MKLIQSMILAVAALVHAIRREALAGNTYDAAVKTHPSTVQRTNDVAITTRHLLWQQGATDGGIALAVAASIPLGTVDNVESATGKFQTVLLLGKGDTKKMVANGAITAGARVFTAAGGKVSPTHGATFCQVGVALTAAGNDGEIIEVADCPPMKTNS